MVSKECFVSRPGFVGGSKCTTVAPTTGFSSRDMVVGVLGGLQCWECGEGRGLSREDVGQ